MLAWVGGKNYVLEAPAPPKKINDTQVALGQAWVIIWWHCKHIQRGEAHNTIQAPLVVPMAPCKLVKPLHGGVSTHSHRCGKRTRQKKLFLIGGAQSGS